MRSRLSPGGGQNQKVHFKAKTGTFFIISYKLGANHVNSYKKLDRKAQNLEITSFTMGIGAKYRDFARNMYLFSDSNFRGIFISYDQFQADQVKEEIKKFLNMYDT